MAIAARAALLLLVIVGALVSAGHGFSIRQALRGIVPAQRELQEDPQLPQQQRCVEILQATLPTVALMFLVLDEMPHEAVWTRWLDGIADRVPAALLCNSEAMACFRALPRGQDNEVYDAQHLFTVYVHTKPEFPGYPEGSLFYRRVVPTQIQTAWGDHSLAAALRLLLAEALRDPLNQRFQLLCPATIPIRPPLFTYTQLLAEPRSRAGWYWPKDRAYEEWAYRFPVPMLEEMPEIEGHTRFHRQFVTLNRRHAALIDADTRVHDLFQRHCFISKEQHGHFCVSDEQYVGTTLSLALGEAIADEVTGDLAIAMATSGGGFASEAITMELIIQLRGSRRNLTLLPDFQDHHGECRAVERLNATIGVYTNNWDAYQTCQAYEARGNAVPPTTVFPHCPYFARKFQRHTVEEVSKLLDDLRIA